MLNLFLGELLFHPAPMEYSANKCTYNCGYCFANNKPKKFESKIDKCIKHLQNPKKDTLLGQLILRKYPICVSNLTDPFSSNNIEDTKALLSILPYTENGVFIQTKGGDIDTILKSIEKIKEKVVYVTITTFSDEIRKRIEPGSPSIEYRFQLVKKLIQNGITVIVALNPLLEEWISFEDFKKYIDKIKECGAENLFIQNLHLNPQVVKSWSEEKIEKMGIKNPFNFRSRFGDMCDYATKCILYAKQYLNVAAYGFPLISNFEQNQNKNFIRHYPSAQKFYNEVMKSGAKEYMFDDFYKSITIDDELFNMPFNNVINYLYKMNMFSYAHYANYDKPSTLKDVLRIIWNDPKFGHSPQNNGLMIRKMDDKMNDILDSNGNKILYHNGMFYGKKIKQQLFYEKK